MIGYYIDAFLTLVLHKLYLLSPETIARMVCWTAGIVAVILGLTCSLFPLFVSWLAELHLRWMDGRKIEKDKE